MVVLILRKAYTATTMDGGLGRKLFLAVFGDGDVRER